MVEREKVAIALDEILDANDVAHQFTLRTVFPLPASYGQPRPRNSDNCHHPPELTKAELTKGQSLCQLSNLQNLKKGQSLFQVLQDSSRRSFVTRGAWRDACSTHTHTMAP